MAANSVLSSPGGSCELATGDDDHFSPSSRARCTLPKQPATWRSANASTQAVNAVAGPETHPAPSPARDHTLHLQQTIERRDIQLRCRVAMYEGSDVLFNLRQLRIEGWKFRLLLRKIMAPSKSSPERIASRLAITLRPLKFATTS